MPGFPLSRDKAVLRCDEGGPAHAFKNVAKPGEKPVWQCVRCPERRQTHVG